MNKKEEIINSWVLQANVNWKTSKNLLKSKDYYACLFFCHLTIEKLIKGLILRDTQKPAPYTHKLEELIQMTNVNTSSDIIDHLTEISEFNINTRYHDSKVNFFKQCNRTFTLEKFRVCEKIVIWLRKEYKNK